MVIIRQDSRENIAIRKITKLPDNLQKYNEEFIEYSCENFESICYYNEIKDKTIEGQYLIAKGKNHDVKHAFSGLEQYFSCELENVDEIKFDKVEYPHAKGLVISDTPSKVGTSVNPS